MRIIVKHVFVYLKYYYIALFFVYLPNVING